MNQAEYKIRNLESQILYLQQEHSSTLKLLHNEIKDLQMKNSEASLQLSMLNITNKDYDNENNQSTNAAFLDQISQLQMEMETLKTQLTMKMTQLEDYNTKIVQLTDTISKLKEHHKSEMAVLEGELNGKSAEIVHLSSKLLHRFDPQTKSAVLGPGDGESVGPKTPYVAQCPVSPKTFKFRNQISVHPDNAQLRRRPIIARQTLVSASVPIKSSQSQPSFPEYAVSVEDRAQFPKSIRRPSVLPPIAPARRHQHVLSDGLSDGLSSSATDRGPTVTSTTTKYYDVPPTVLPPATQPNDCQDTNVSHSHAQTRSKAVTSFEVDRLLDFNNSSLSRASVPSATHGQVHLDPQW